MNPDKGFVKVSRLSEFRNSTANIYSCACYKVWAKKLTRVTDLRTNLQVDRNLC